MTSQCTATPFQPYRIKMHDVPPTCTNQRLTHTPKTQLLQLCRSSSAPRHQTLQRGDMFHVLRMFTLTPANADHPPKIIGAPPPLVAEVGGGTGSTRCSKGAYLWAKQTSTPPLLRCGQLLHSRSQQPTRTQTSPRIRNDYLPEFNS